MKYFTINVLLFTLIFSIFLFSMHAYAMLRNPDRVLEYSARYSDKHRILEDKFLTATRTSDVESFNECISQGVNINCTSGIEDYTALHTICSRCSLVDNKKTVTNFNTLLAQPSVNVNAKDKIHGRTPLHYFIEQVSDCCSEYNAANCNSAIVLLKRLLQRGANPKISDHEGKFPIQMGIIPNPELIDLLRQHRSPLTYAIAVELTKKSLRAPPIASFAFCFSLVRKSNTPNDFKTKELAKKLIEHYNWQQDHFKNNSQMIFITKLNRYILALQRLKTKFIIDRMNGEAFAFQEYIAKDTKS